MQLHQVETTTASTSTFIVTKYVLFWFSQVECCCPDFARHAFARHTFARQAAAANIREAKSSLTSLVIS